MLIRRPTEKDLCFLTRCNNSEAKWVGVEEPSFFENYMNLPYFMVAEEDGKQAGFLLAMGPEVDYDSKNFLWFRERMKDFAYVDRVIINPEFRRKGIASALYKELFARTPNIPTVCEVAIKPDENSESIPFHEGFSFLGIGEFSANGKKLCTMYYRSPSDGFLIKK